MGKVAGYKVRIRGSRRELIWKGSSTDEDEGGVGEEESGPPDMRIRASRRELVWDKKEERGGEGREEEENMKESTRKKKEEDLYYGGQKIKHFKSKEELPNSRVSCPTHQVIFVKEISRIAQNLFSNLIVFQSSKDNFPCQVFFLWI